MNFKSTHRVNKPRRVLGELDPNRDLNTPRGQSKRAPITFEQENEQAVFEGLRFGTYDRDEVIAWTDYGLSSATANRHTPIGSTNDSDDEDPARSPALTHTQVHASAPGHESEDLMSEPDMEAEYEEAEVGDDEFLDDVMDEDLGEDLDDEQNQDDQDIEDDEIMGPVFDPAAIGLKEINNLAHFGVSSHKPGNGVEELLSDDLDKFWQSDGQQPHLLTIHFLRRVDIRAIRFYVDYTLDESYTPIHIVFYAGTGHHDLIQFADLPLVNPVGWQDVPIADCGGGPDGHSLCCYIVQVHIKENHQNGKDTHIRAIKIFALDENNAPGGGPVSDAVHEMEANIDQAADRLTMQSLADDEDETFQELLYSLDRQNPNAVRYRPGEGGFSNYPDFMREPEIR
ncbi:anaphase-promoting complex, subunit 10-domain-containing protein [Bombardia bombarda]|uniref:Anaphase-promoting complex, subunit 10-domain-containing protein n=1 Tax=Bombardia bombarda TaxID=252184 RepID=A0AA40BV75_9PEZI|nr:anaphase-promoting complex, subunit 10-domain-containing protein [Bombardia bombarda]